MAKKRPPRTPPLPAAPPEPQEPPEIELDDEERQFVDEYLIDADRIRAYHTMRPGCSYRTARRRGQELFNRPHVQAEIRAARRSSANRCQITAERTLKELARVAYSDVIDLYDPQTNTLRLPRHIPLEVRRAIASVKVARERRSVRTSGRTRTTVSDTVIEYKFWPKMQALEKLCRHLGLQTEITPLDALLAALPRPLAMAVRGALAEQNTANPPPTPNGKH